MNTKLATALLALGLLTGLLLVLAVPAQAIATLTVDPPKYHGTYYVPGEEMTFTIDILATDPVSYDVLVVWDDGVTRTNWSGPPNQAAHLFDDITFAAGQTSMPLTFTIPMGMPDGDSYWIEVHGDTWIETDGATGGTMDFARFSVRTWILSIETDRNQYLPGDTVKVLWSANMIRDGSLAVSGYGQLWFYDWPTNTPIQGVADNPLVFTASTGEYSFELPPVTPTNRWVHVYGWYNNTQTAANRFWFAEDFTEVNGLRMMVNVLAATYEPAGVVTVDVMSKNVDFVPNAGSPGAANVEVDIGVRRTGALTDEYSVSNLLTDLHGNLRWVFQLNTSIPDGTQFVVTADGSKHNAVFNSATDSFTVTENAGMTLVLSFNKAQYLSGDNVVMTAAVGGSTPPFTFIYEARDTSNGNLLDRETTSSSQYTYTIGTNFDGQITFSADVDDGQGNRRSESRTFTVLAGILLVTLDRTEYNAGDTITAVYSFTRNSGVMANPTYFYEVLDATSFPYVLVRSGTATGGSVQYTVPAVPGDSYIFRITATDAGRTVSNSATADYVGGVILRISTDRSAYNAGDVIRVDYSLVPRGRTALPSSFTFVLGIPGFPGKTVQTAQSSGSLAYGVPGEMNDGQMHNTFIIVQEASTGGYAAQAVTIGGNPLWVNTVGGIPAFDVILALLLVLVIIVMVLMWRRGGMGFGAPPRAPGEKAAEKPPAPPTAMPGTAPMTMSCKACGAPIEITTSKRPIEVMCPSCGETQMVQ